ncbi:MAG: flagellar filament capping protein FliD [Desulfovibrionaceae bacterium]|nr:flagellar filament capping protein FliD [Desulfovibrionaceae bacterium]
MAVEYTSGSIHFSGLGSDTDFDTMITQLKTIESSYKNRLTLWQADWNRRIDAFQQLNTAMLSLSSTLNSMNTMNKFLLKTATSSNESIMTATATSAAQNNSNKIEVKKLATNAAYTWEGCKFSSAKDKVNNTDQTQNFVYTYKGKTVKIAVGANATMEQFINQINSDANNPGVRAALIKNGNEYVFQLQGQDTGASATLTIDASSSSELAIKPPTESTEFATRFSSADAVINNTGSDQNFVYTYNGQRFTMVMADGSSLNELAEAINNDVNNPGVKAAVVQSGNMYSLQIKPDDASATVQTAADSPIKIQFTTQDGGSSTGWNTTSYNLERTSSDLRFDKASRSINSSGAEQNFVWNDSAGLRHTIAVAAGATLSELASQINAAGFSTRAEVCKDSNGYYLQLTELNPNHDAAPEIDASSSAYLAITASNTHASAYTTETESYTQHSQGFVAPDATINYSGSDQTFKYTYDGKTYSVQVGAGATLEDLAAAINNNQEIYSGSDAISSKVRARIGCDGENAYRLYLYSTEGNTSERIAIASDSSSALEIAPPRAAWTNSGKESTYGRKFSSVDEVINTTGAAQDFKFIDGNGNLQTVSVAAGGTLQSLIYAINTDSANGVTAEKVEADGKVQLKLVGDSGPVRVESTSSRMLSVSADPGWSSSSVEHSITFGNFADAGAVINSSGEAQTFAILYKDKQYSVSLNDGATLQNLVNAINNDPELSALVEAGTALNGNSTQFVLKGKDASPDTPTIADGSSSALAVYRNTVSSYINKEKNTVSDVITAINGNVINNSGSDQTFTYSYNGTTGSITVPNGCTMEQFIDLINDNKNMKDVYASAEYLGVDAAGKSQYKLHLSGTNPGKAPTVSASTSKHDDFAIRPPVSEFSYDYDVPSAVYELALSGDDVVNATGQEQKFMVEYMGKNISLTIQPDETVNDLIDKLNSQTNGQIKANLITGQDGNQYLQLWGTDPTDSRPPQVSTTSSQDLLIAPPKIDSGGWYIQLNSNAQLKLNDWPEGDEWIESETNSPTELIEGVNLNLKDVGTAQLTVTTNSDGIKEQIVAFVDALNSVRSLINELTSVDTGKTTEEIGETASNFDAQLGSILTGNYGVQLLSSIMKSTTASQAKGFQYQYTDVDGLINGDLFTSLAHVGITTCAETNNPNIGLLVIDEEKLDAALAQDAQAVAELFAADNKAAVDTTDFTFGGYISGQTQAGTFEFHYSVNADDNILDPYVISDGKRYKANWDSETNQITIMEGPGKGLSIQINNTAQGDYTGKVTLKMGKVGELSALVSELNSDDGILNILEDNYKQISNNIQDKIDKEEERLIVWERNMREKFARLEATLAQYNALQSQLDSTISQLDKD